jgi:chromatin remodeling complex protein RSC6
MKRLWEYITSNQLQDPADRCYILCDDKLKSIFQQDRVNIFGMFKDLTAHLTKKRNEQ